MPRKKQGLRSYHHKSRNGCCNCKRRRVKCNMQAPACANCVRRNEMCEYQTLDTPPPNSSQQWTAELPIGGHHGSTVVVAGSLEVSPNALGSYASPTWFSPHNGGLPSGTLETTVSFDSPLSHSLSTMMGSSWFSSQEISLWTPALERSATKYEYLQHSIYSLTALLDVLNARCANELEHRAPVAAYQHHIAASTLFCQSPPVVDEENWVAVLCFGITTIIFHFAAQQMAPDSDFCSYETFRILRNSMALNESTLPYLSKSKFWLLSLQRTSMPSLIIDVKLRTALQKLGLVVAQGQEIDVINAGIATQAFFELRDWAFGCRGKPRRWRHYLFWPAAVNEEFLDLMAAGDDIALLILIHWCAIMYQSPRRWFFTTWSKRTALQAIGMLKSDWGDVLAYPSEVFDLVPIATPGLFGTYPALPAEFPDLVPIHKDFPDLVPVSTIS